MKILEELWYEEFNYKGMRTNAFGIPISFVGSKKETVSSTMSRLKRKGYVGRGSEGWIITAAGRKYYEDHKELRKFESPFAKSAPKNLIVMFDVPEQKKHERDWLRRHLHKFGYEMIQKSVWVGPSPLPSDFAKYAKEIGVKKCMKTFKLAKPYRRAP